MPTYRDEGERKDPASSEQLLRTRLELFEHNERVRKALKKELPALLEKLVVDDMKGAESHTIRVSVADPGFFWARPQENEEGGDGDQQEFDLDGKEEKKGKKAGSGAGAGDVSPQQRSYGKEVPLNEIMDELFDLVDLPIDVRKRMRGMRKRIRRAGIKKRGPRSRLDARATHKEKVGREKKTGKKQSYRLGDRRYRGIVKRKDRAIAARVYLIRDSSGSMNDEKVALLTALVMLVYWFLKTKYREIEIVCVCHDTDAEVVSPERFFSAVSIGGTRLSSGVEHVLQREADDPCGGDVFVWHVSDGENETGDNTRFARLVKEVLAVAVYFGFVSVKPTKPGSTMGFAAPSAKGALETILHRHDNLHMADIHSFDDVREAFLHLFRSQEKKRRKR